MDTIGERLRATRKQRGWSQPELAERSGVRQTTISNYEQARTAPSGESAARLAAALNVSLEWLLTGEGPQEISSLDPDPVVAELAALRSEIAGLTEDVRRLLEVVANRQPP